MTPRTYPHGVPCWVDTEQPDLRLATRFYGGVLGWTFTDAVPPDAPGSYLVATLDGQDVAAIGPGDGAPAWNTYLAADDADATAAAVTAAGGTVVAPPADAGPGGRTASCADPSGAAFRLWQARARPGAQSTNAPGTWNFSNLRTPDAAAATAFYGTVFGVVADQVGQGDWTATMLRVPGYGEHLAATVDPGILDRQDGIGAPPGFADAVGWLETGPAGRAGVLARHLHRRRPRRDGGRRRAARRRRGVVAGHGVDAGRARPRPGGRRLHRQPVHAARLTPRRTGTRSTIASGVDQPCAT